VWRGWWWWAAVRHVPQAVDRLLEEVVARRREEVWAREGEGTKQQGSGEVRPAKYGRRGDGPRTTRYAGAAYAAQCAHAL